MATPEIKDILPGDILSDQYTAQVYVTDEVVKGLVIAPTLGMDSTEEDHVDWYRRESTSKQMFQKNLIEKPMPSKHGELLQVSGSELTPNNEYMNTFGYKYTVTQYQIENSPQPFLYDIQDLCYGISQAIEDSAVTTLTSVASASPATINDGTWDQSTQIAEDLSNFDEEYLERDINGVLDTLFYNSKQFGALRNYIIATEGVKNLVKNGNAIDYSGMFHNYAPAVTAGETFGFDSKLPPAQIIYRKIPGAYEPIATKPGTEDYLPVINMKMIDKDGPGLEPVREFRFGACWTIPVARPASIFVKQGI